MRHAEARVSRRAVLGTAIAAPMLIASRGLAKEETRMTEKTIATDGVELATQAFGDPADPPVLLIMGITASMLWWDEGFCRRLADNGRFVIRYDNRDTGLSTAYPPGAPGYVMEDLAEDAMRVLDGYDIERAHLVGMSMGGVIAQMAALAHPARVASLTAISTWPLGEDTSALPQTTDAYMQHAASAEHLDWTDDDAVIAFLRADVRAIAGTAHPHDADRARALIERDVGRARSFASATNHFMLKPRDDWQGRLAALEPPLLVIHGLADPIFPPEHGRALAAAVSGARLVEIEGGGHELHPADWDRILAAILAHGG